MTTPYSWGSLEASGRMQKFHQPITILLGQCPINHIQWTLPLWVVWFRMLKLHMFTSTATDSTTMSTFGLTLAKGSGKIVPIDGLLSQLILSSIPSTIFLFSILLGRILGCQHTLRFLHIALVSILGGGWWIFSADQRWSLIQIQLIFFYLYIIYQIMQAQASRSMVLSLTIFLQNLKGHRIWSCEA